MDLLSRFVETFAAASGLSDCDAIVYAILIVVLLMRPAGILGKNVKEELSHETKFKSEFSLAVFGRRFASQVLVAAVYSTLLLYPNF